MAGGANPMVPSQWEVLVGGMGFLIIALLVWSVLALAYSRLVSGPERLGLLAACLLLPVIGPAAALLLLHRIKRRQRGGAAVGTGRGRGAG